MARRSLPRFEKKQMMGLIAIISFGLTALLALVPVLGEVIGPMIFILGFFILIPLVYVLGDDFPLVVPEGGHQPPRPTDPIEELRDRYARGEIGDEEFERRLDRLLETEDLDLHVGEHDHNEFEYEQNR